jgi:hypothetical protein
VVTGTDVVALVPSPKLQAYDVIVPEGADDAEPSNDVGEPGGDGVTVNAAEGAWSGTTAIPFELEPIGMAVPAVLVARLIGMMLVAPRLPTYAV